MRIRAGLVPLNKCVISLRLSLEPLSWTVTIMQSPSNIVSFIMAVSGLLVRLISPLLKDYVDMGVGGSSSSKTLFIASQIWQCMGRLFPCPNFTRRDMTFPWIWLASKMLNKRQGRQMRGPQSLKWISGSSGRRILLITPYPSTTLGGCH